MPTFFNESEHFNLHSLKMVEDRDANKRPLKDMPDIGYGKKFVDEISFCENNNFYKFNTP